MKKALCALMLTSAIAGSPVSASTIVTFDDLASDISVQNGYNGFDWNNFYATNGAQSSPGSGYVSGTVSPSNVGYNGGGALATVSAGSPFVFNSGYFTSAWNNGMSVVATGFVGGVATYTSTFAVSSTSATLHSFNWANLSSVSFVGTGGTYAGYGSGGQHIAFDNLTFGAAVPEPATWAIMIAGFGIVGSAMRRRKSAVRTTVSFA